MHYSCVAQLVKESGGLQRLVAFITDTQPPEEEEKKGKKEKGASRAGKKGKGGDDGECLCVPSMQWPINFYNLVS